MRSALDSEADAIVAEMIGLSASFNVSHSGPAGEARWFYEARPSMREPLRRFKAGHEWTKPGMEAAMIRAILRTKFVGAP